MKPYSLSWDGHTLELGRRTCIMGIVNVTPDSFSDGGRYLSSEAAVARGEQLAAAGADILDIGGESTRPFADPVSIDEEIRRVVPVISALSGRVGVPISIDTRKAAVARAALAAGASIINDITALKGDPEMGRLAADAGVPVVLMHMQGTPETMQVTPTYADLLGEIKTFLGEAITAAEHWGVRRSRIIIDPGIGFGKTVAHNLCLLNHIDQLGALDVPVLIGSSRKAFIRKLLGESQAKAIAPDSPAAAIGTQASVSAAILRGAHIVRVHDVARTRTTARIIDAIKNT